MSSPSRKLLFAALLAITAVGCDDPQPNPTTGCVAASDCDDQNACTTDLCQAGTCANIPVAMDDGGACTVDACDPQTGVSHTAVAVDDGDLCTVDACDPQMGVSHTPVNVDDGNACTTDACDPTTGVSHSPVDVDDDDACTTDACDPTSGAITHAAVAVDDGNACTVDACDPATGVSHTDVDPDDGVSCTVDSCDAQTGTFEHVAQDSLCGANAVCDPVQDCVAVAQPDLLISEFQALGSEFIELHNASAAPVDVYGYEFTNGAGQTAQLRSVTDPSGMTSAPVTVPAGGYVYGVPNPAAGTALPAGATFVYGAQGTTFALADTGDVLTLNQPAGAGVMDVVDFQSFVTDPDAVQTAMSFPGHTSASTQLDPGALTSAGNDHGDHWCTTFYPASARVKVADTRGAPNGDCDLAVINELFVDPAGGDEGKAFIEIAGPGGALIGSAHLTDIEGIGTTAGATNAPDIVLPSGLRIPVDGILLVADGDVDGGVTQVPNVAASDVVVADADFENGGGDSIQLISLWGTLWDAVATTAGPPLATTMAQNGFGMVEGNPALFIGNGSSIARSATSADTGDNVTDFHGDPSPTPGLPSDPVVTTITAISPNDTPAGIAVTANVVVTGTDFASGLTLAFGSLGATGCTLQGSTQVTCTAPANNVAGTVDVTLANPLAVGTSATVPSAFTWTVSDNETDLPQEADYCVLQWPPTLTTTSGQTTDLVYAQLYEPGVTETAGAPANVLAEVGFGPPGTSPLMVTTWRFFPMGYNVQSGNNDEFQGTLPAPTVTTSSTYAYTARFSFDGGVSWTYCDLNGAGSNSGLSFEQSQLGTLTVTP